MAKISGLAQNFYLDGFDLSGDVATIENAASPRNVLEVTALDKSAVERILGLSDGEISFNTWFNTTAGQEHAALSGLPTTDVHVMWLITATAQNDTAAVLVSKQINYDLTRGADKSVAFSVQCLANGTPLEWGNMLTAGKRTDSTATDGTTFDGTASTSNGLIAYLQVFAFTGTSVTITIQDGTASPATDDLKAFASVTGRTTERVTVTGTVNRFLRVKTAGTFSNVVFAVWFRRGQSQDDVDLS